MAKALSELSRLSMGKVKDLEGKGETGEAVDGQWSIINSGETKETGEEGKGGKAEDARMRRRGEDRHGGFKLNAIR
jgi:hypothetical protein